MKPGFYSVLALAYAVVGCGSDAGPTSPEDSGSQNGGDVGAGEAGSDALASDATRSTDAGVESGGGEAGSDAGSSDARSADAGGDASAAPMLLSETGLYADITKGTLGPDVIAYQPQFILWADAATKNRWVKLPAGSQIDTSDMNFWSYPNGTKLFKEFSVGAVRLETRMIMKRSAGDWFMMSYQWNAAQTEAVAVPDGVVNASGTTHDIPSQQDCGTCHGAMKDNVLGFTAIQLSHAIQGSLNLDQIVAKGWLTNPPAAGTKFVIPGNAVDQAALGYLHANCGLCHNSLSNVFRAAVDVDVWLQVDKMSTVAQTPTYTTLVGRATTGNISHLALRVAPGDPPHSAIHELMALRAAPGDAGAADNKRQMPPLATKVPDTAGGLAAIDAWIKQLPPLPADGGRD
jgi:hypothetical protein